MITKQTTYGKPSDPFIRITEEVEHDPVTDTLHIRKRILVRGQVGGISGTVTIPCCPPRAMA